ncbi:DUF6879 family protein [Micromonospora sp. NBC_01813]|uniref:DUF6879 family protein n=1 Tax=Micromonospora sp. NBC_01813 TaxID=2975988 RepID=UPI002DD9044D|nr:DUF6879 family protein [Micromonospora sp. NBC_01813]WSA08543.1 hypothetical protein OG958_30910 [Micromonospora sp. NBC_01813]
MAATTFEDLLDGCRAVAAHLEMRDAYSPHDPIYLDWKAGRKVDPIDHEREWYDLAVRTVARGVAIRRARIVSEPISDWIRHELETTPKLNLRAGEQVRWLPRRQASDLALPGNDFWLFDGKIVRFGFFSGDGNYVGDEVVEDPDTVSRCCSAFEAVWERGIDHRDYDPDRHHRYKV